MERGSGWEDDIVLGEFRGRPAFVVPSTRRSLLGGLLGNAAVAIVGAIMALAIPVPVLRFGGVYLFLFGTYLTVMSWRAMRVGSDLVLTPKELAVRDGAGTLRVEWLGVDESPERHDIAPPPLFRWVWPKNRLYYLSNGNEPVLVEGHARAWHPFHSGGRSALTCYPFRHRGGLPLLSALLPWCLRPENRSLIGTEAGRMAFIAEAANAPGPSSMTADAPGDPF